MAAHAHLLVRQLQLYHGGARYFDLVCRLYLGKFDELGRVHIARPRLTGAEGRKVQENLAETLHISFFCTLTSLWLLSLWIVDNSSSSAYKGFSARHRERRVTFRFDTSLTA